MAIYVSILRGINVSGKRMIKMEVLKKLFAELGFSAIQTYIQSGNIIFQHKKSDPSKLSANIKGSIEKKFGFEVPVITLLLEELQEVVKLNPLLKDKSKDPAYFHVTFLAAQPNRENVEKITAGNYYPDEFHLIDKAVYLYCPNSYSNSKLTNNFLESKLKVTATTRNWKTTNELLAMAEKLNQ
jgi:uncharacterized protein (DUF1697 family)